MNNGCMMVRGGTLVLGAAFLCGCQSAPPAGNSAGRISTSEQTRADVFSERANMPDLYAYCDEAAEMLALDVADIFANHDTRVIIELGEVENNTNTPSSDFRLIRQRLNQKIQSNRHIGNYAIVVLPRQSGDRSRDRILGDDQPDLLQEGFGDAGSDRYDPEITYILGGEFHESRRGGRRYYFFNLRLTNLQSRAMVWTKATDQSYTAP